MIKPTHFITLTTPNSATITEKCDRTGNQIPDLLTRRTANHWNVQADTWFRLFFKDDNHVKAELYSSSTDYFYISILCYPKCSLHHQIIHATCCILNAAYCILHSTSLILLAASNILHASSYISVRVSNNLNTYLPSHTSFPLLHIQIYIN